MFGRANGVARRSGRTSSGGVNGSARRPVTADPRMASGMDHEVENMQPRDDDALLTPSEVAAMFRVNPKTVTRWARAGKMTAIRTLGGHRRFCVSEIRRCLEEMSK